LRLQHPEDIDAIAAKLVRPFKDNPIADIGALLKTIRKLEAMVIGALFIRMLRPSLRHSSTNSGLKPKQKLYVKIPNAINCAKPS